MKNNLTLPLKKVSTAGFTLIEIITVIVIMGILAVIAVPKFTTLGNEAKISATQSTLGAIRSILTIEYANNANAGNAAFPSSLGASNFADGKLPINSLTGVSGVAAVGASPGGSATSNSSGFWFIPSTGFSGAYSDGTTDTGNW